jgi:hypothetical protein
MMLFLVELDELARRSRGSEGSGHVVKQNQIKVQKILCIFALQIRAPRVVLNLSAVLVGHEAVHDQIPRRLIK